MPRLKMHGPVLARKVIHDHLKAVLPAALVDLRTEWALSAATLPDPVLYVPREPDQLDRWPTVAVTTGVEATTRRVEHDSGGGEFVTEYPVEVYVWVRADSRGAVQDMRDYMATALKVVLLGNPTFDRPAQDMLLNESTFEQRYSDIQAVKGERFVAGAMSTFDLSVVEHLGPFGSQTSATVDRVLVRGYSEGNPFGMIEAFPAHPAFE